MMMAPAAFWTLSIVRAAKRKGSMAPRRAPARTMGSGRGEGGEELEGVVLAEKRGVFVS